MGFEQYIKSHVDNDGMAFNPTFYHANRAAAAALADALWSGQSTVEMFRRHERARLTWDSLDMAPQVRVPALVLCGEDDKVERQGSTPVDTARRLGQAIPGAELALIPGVRHMTFWDGHRRHRRAGGFPGTSSHRIGGYPSGGPHAPGQGTAEDLQGRRQRSGRPRGVTQGVEEGEFFVLLGPSGSGKTTLLRCVAGLETPDAGEIEIDGATVFSGGQGISAPPEDRKIGMVFQSYAIWPHMTVFQNVACR